VPEQNHELGRLAGLIEGLQLQVSEQTDAIRRLNCVAHAERLERIEVQLDRIDIGGRPRSSKPSSSGTPTVSQADLDRRLESTERTVLERAGSQLEHSLKEQVAERVMEALNKRRDEEVRAATERRELERRDEEKKATQLAEQIKAKAFADETRWKRVQWVVGVLTAILGSGTVASHCGLGARLDADRAAVVKALQAQPQPIVVKMPVLPVPTPDIGMP